MKACVTTVTFGYKPSARIPENGDRHLSGKLGGVSGQKAAEALVDSDPQMAGAKALSTRGAGSLSAQNPLARYGSPEGLLPNLGTSIFGVAEGGAGFKGRPDNSAGSNVGRNFVTTGCISAS